MQTSQHYALAYTFVIHNGLEGDVELVPIGAVIASGDSIERTLAGGVESSTVLLLDECGYFILVIDPVKGGS